MRRRVWEVLALAAITTCGGEPAADDPPASARPADSAQPAPNPHALSDGPDGMTLRLPPPGTSRAELLSQQPECRAELEPAGDRCTFHGWIRPLSQPCDGGCTWWTYRFEGDLLDTAELERTVWDVDAEYADAFAEEAVRVADELTRRLGVAPRIDALEPWTAVEASPEGERVLLARRTWALDDVLVTWLLSGRASHHPGVLLNVRVETAHPDQLRVEMLQPELTTGAPLLRLRGGPVPRPFEVPLWLTFDARDRAYDNCSLGHEAVAFPLPDGRIYVGQTNSLCGGAGQCRILDPRTGVGEPPPGGCLGGEGIHHRATAIGDGYVLSISDAEGGGAVEIVRYDPVRGAEVRLHLSFGATATLRAEVRDGGVDFSTVCDLPAGCEQRDYGEVPERAYRWTPGRGLVAR